MNTVNEINALVESRSAEQSSPDVAAYCNRIVEGDCTSLLRHMPSRSVDLVVTDPPYVANYVDRAGRRVFNDDNSRWIYPAFSETYRILKDDSFCFSFYGFSHADKFLSAWRECGFRPVGHFSFVKTYSSSIGFTKMSHECAYLLTKGRPPKPTSAPSDVLPFKYTGNKLHPTQKPLSVLTPIIEAYSQPGDIVLDPFGGSGSTAIAAQLCKRRFVLFEKEAEYCHATRMRLLAHEDPL